MVDWFSRWAGSYLVYQKLNLKDQIRLESSVSQLTDTLRRSSHMLNPSDNIIAATPFCFPGYHPFTAYRLLSKAGIRNVEVPALSFKELLSIGVEKHQAAFSSGTWLTGIPLTYLAPW